MLKIPEYPDYSITEDGKLWSDKSNKFLSGYTNNKGYYCYKINHNNKQYTFTLHRLLARAYNLISSLDSELEIDHIDTDSTNNDISNLQALTSEQHLLKTLEERGFNKANTVCNCGNIKDSQANKCKLCSSLSQVKDLTVTAELIEQWVSKFSWVRAGKELGYSDTGLRKRYKTLSGKDPKSIKRVKC